MESNVNTSSQYQTPGPHHHGLLQYIHGAWDYLWYHYLPVIRENWTLQDNLLQQLNQLVGQVGGHEGLDGDADVLRVLGLGQGGLDHLVNQRPPELVLVGQDLEKYFALLYNKLKSLKVAKWREDEWRMMKDDGWMMKDNDF